MTSKRYILYCRKSSEGEDRQQLSLSAQLDELQLLARKQKLTIIGEPLQEAKSAKTPGRKQFNFMMQEIQEGRADGILCWHLDRLARNPRDGGEVMHELLNGSLAEIITPYSTYTGTADDGLMMSILFGMATKYSSDLSANVRRGNEKALRSGRWTGRPRLGYRRNPKTKEIEADPERFELVRDLWKRRLRGEPTEHIVDYAKNTQALTTPDWWHPRPGTLVARTYIYKMFTDPFFAGVMIRAGISYPGNHPPMVTWEEFESVSALHRTIRKTASPRYTYQGILTCGSCNRAVIARQTINRYGTRYVYYHCSQKNRRYGFCPERSVKEQDLEAQFIDFLGSLDVPDEVVAIARNTLVQHESGKSDQQEAAKARLEKRLALIKTRQRRLRELLLDNDISKSEYTDDRQRLTSEEVDVSQKLKSLGEQRQLMKPFDEAISFAELAKKSFELAEPGEKRDIIRKVSCNPTIKGKTLHISAKNEFGLLRDLAQNPALCAARDVVETFIRERSCTSLADST